MGSHVEQGQGREASRNAIPAVEILQMNAQELTDFVRELSLENPMVEIEEAEPEDKEEERIQKLEWLAGLDEQNRTYYQYDKGDSEDYLNNVREDTGESLKDALMLQLIGKDYSKLEMGIFAYIADALDASGYYTEGLEDICRQFGVDKEKAAACLEVMKGLEPAGVCAASLQESLARQVGKLGEGHEAELGIISNYMELLGENQLSAIAKEMELPLERIEAAARNIRALNPRPAQGFGKGGILRYAVPDVIIVKFQGRFEILQNNYTYPEIHVSQEYLQMMKTDCGAEAKEYLADKLRQVEQVQRAIGRRGAILLNLAKCLLEAQEEFFLYGQKSLRPFSVGEAAKRLSLSEGAVSQVVKGKYLQCSWGMYPLSYFFKSVG